jgi:hypothetical protein
MMSPKISISVNRSRWVSNREIHLGYIIYGTIISIYIVVTVTNHTNIIEKIMRLTLESSSKTSEK